MKKSDRTREKILKAGLKLWPHITLKTIAKEIKMTHPAILYYFPRSKLKDAIADYAVEVGDSRVILQLFLAGHKATEKLSQADKIRHFNAV